MTRVIVSLFALSLVGPMSGVAQAQDADAGERLFRQRCSSCHSLQAGENRIGPSLHGIVGSQAGSTQGARYSRAMRDADLLWDPETLTAFLERPRDLVRGTSMSIAIRNEDDREDIVAFLEQAASSD
ncbi:c-type cytochrome [Roseibium aggregatum]|uniref:C-type cytochrome n=1 Tax=Roseibium aggregatum TaxID=187304 RepID=A0A939EC83_9HYPH|nr:c-type cytochrome [Roseibium aggregatum]MBN9670547.1 c-type cytochrome [Roseibium aggregatum]